MRKYETELNQKNIKIIAGTDEVGRGPLSGPLVAAAVILPEDYFHPLIKDIAISYSIIEIDVKTIDEINIKNASKLGMKKAIESLTVKPEFVLVDFETLDISIDQLGIVKGDANSISIAAASIIAKVHRDEIMQKLHEEFPEYDWNKNVGYGSKKHRDAILEKGWTIHHRKTFNPVKTLLKNKS